ncbi:uncharacterized protein BYT42DRAFT_236587 [Radiomyces spectabilis]|uniref:uncharacterized protein n=1 Tax=Radiomyces spectabilis TaxID=64574 RepID=UPI0022212062|nr:uncharacterized protein BYT42DRAFT_236587 [Radiomyces spectabilis]KAI8388476.1 hypothetical protein BYT42DRAFT_236587 [Radiomyces spectabilis]
MGLPCRRVTDALIVIYTCRRPSDMPKPNKRFLLNMVKATDSHNQAVIRAAERNASRAHQRLHHRDTSSSRHRRRSRSRSSSSSPSRKRTRTSTRSRSPSDSRSRSRCDDGGSRTDSDEEDSMDERREYDRYRENRSSQKRPHSRSPDRRPKRSLSVSPARKLGGKVNPSSKPVQIRGRGKISMNRSAMDKYFQDEYDPSKDIPSDEDQYVFAKETDTIKAKKDKKKKKKKSKKSKKSKKHKHDKRSSDDSLSASDFDAPTVVMPKPSIRAWDIGKTSFDH